MAVYDEETIADLIDGELEWVKLKEIISNPKDPERFDQIVQLHGHAAADVYQEGGLLH